jgi:hypothetical protein
LTHVKINEWTSPYEGYVKMMAHGTHCFCSGAHARLESTFDFKKLNMWNKYICPLGRIVICPLGRIVVCPLGKISMPSGQNSNMPSGQNSSMSLWAPSEFFKSISNSKYAQRAK